MAEDDWDDAQDSAPRSSPRGLGLHVRSGRIQPRPDTEPRDGRCVRNQRLTLVAGGSARWRDEPNASKPAFYCLDRLPAGCNELHQPFFSSLLGVQMADSMLGH
jgi:hypothetical protein